MWAVVSTDQIENLERSRAFVSILLNDTWEGDFTNVLARQYENLNQRLGEHWHLVIPTKMESYELNNALNEKPEQFPVFAKDYDDAFALELAKGYGLEPSDFPCIVFDNFSSEKSQIVVSLKGFSSNDMRAFFDCFVANLSGYNFAANDAEQRNKDILHFLRLYNTGRYGRKIKVIMTDPMTIAKMLPQIIAKISFGIF